MRMKSFKTRTIETAIKSVVLTKRTYDMGNSVQEFPYVERPYLVNQEGQGKCSEGQG